MAPKKNAAASPSPAAVPPSAAKPTAAVTSASGTPTKAANKPSTKDIRNAQDMQEIAVGMWNNYVDKTPQRVKLLDAFLVFLMTVGMWQFVYCVIAGNFPFNAFLSGFSATVGQFVLTVSLRIQTNPENKADFESISHERAFADFIFGSMILHFFCVNFIN
ncbi:hypothetical protein WHR41_04994 [Cladosporium halotolerans]|uniref:Dolichyl-diphosphooligosaccharide--protein glycosyltransferase subunit OST2 n=1 Tax=Cladosporium halotolerans TaxID=1052096 RepID=A0AB34KQ57_9PEZI